MVKTLTILQSFQEPRPTTNPYLIMLKESLHGTPDTAVLTFSWRTALLGRYDVFHVHWPEILVGGHSPLKKSVRQVLTLLLLVRLRLTKRPIVRTVHNVGLPSGISMRATWLLRLMDRQTAYRILLNSSTDVRAGEPHTIIPHGHYRDWFAKYPRKAVVAGQIGYFGLIRPYKGVENLIESFRDTRDDHPELTLRIGGNPSSEQTASAIRDLATGDERISLDLRFLSEAELAEVATSSELVVLPYLFMHNSGGTLAALSLERPVLVPDNDVNRRLAEEVGAGWVHRFSGELTSKALVEALAAVRSGAARSARPNLAARGWTEAGANHVAAYREALRLTGAGRG